MRICAGGALLKDGEILLGLRSANRRLYPDTWDVFGGHCQNNESVEGTLIREFKEEIGVRPIRFEELGAFGEPDPQKYSDALYHVFAVHEWEGRPENIGREHQTIRWFRYDELQHLNLASPKYLEMFRHQNCSAAT